MNIGVDVGGTKIAAGVVSEAGEILATRRIGTPEGSPNITRAIAELVSELRDGYAVQAVGISAAGFITPDRERVAFAPNLSWENDPLARNVADATQLPVVIENDANAAAWGEYRFGAARGHESAVIVTVGTGIGGGIIIGGKLVRGAHGFGAEIGHMILNPHGETCGCGLHGCWEAHGSGTALVRTARKLATEHPERASILLNIANSRSEATGSSITGTDITQAARQGDPVALEAFADIARWNGTGIAALAALLDPSIFVISGGVCEAGDLLLEPIRREFAAALTARAHRAPTPITIATLGNSAGLIGAADLARQ